MNASGTQSAVVAGAATGGAGVCLVVVGCGLLLMSYMSPDDLPLFEILLVHHLVNFACRDIHGLLREWSKRGIGDEGRRRRRRGKGNSRKTVAGDQGGGVVWGKERKRVFKSSSFMLRDAID